MILHAGPIHPRHVDPSSVSLGILDVDEALSKGIVKSDLLRQSPVRCDVRNDPGARWRCFAGISLVRGQKKYAGKKLDSNTPQHVPIVCTDKKTHHLRVSESFLNGDSGGVQDSG